MVRIPVPDQDKIDFGKPSLTLDVNVLALRPPDTWPSGLPHLEWNYFETHFVELCVTPQAVGEILQGQPVTEVGSAAYNRFQKSEFFKKRPPGTVLTFTQQEANNTWMDLRDALFPTVTDSSLTANQRADVTQIFYHLTVSSSVTNAAFVTTDGNFLSRRDDLCNRFGITVFSPGEAWNQLQPMYRLVAPTMQDIQALWEQQHAWYERLRQEAER